MRLYPAVRFTLQGDEVEGARCVDCHTVVFDGTCTVCKRTVAALRGMDERSDIAFVPYQSPGVGARFPWIEAGAFEEAVHYIAPDGRTWQGARAIEEVLRILPKGRRLSVLFRMPLARPVAERFYQWFARRRRHLGCGDHCSTGLGSPQRGGRTVS